MPKRKRSDDESEEQSVKKVRAETRTSVGVQLVLDDTGNVTNVVVAGRPTSPFTGTMGDHVTAFGVHVVNLQRAMTDVSLEHARETMTKLLDEMKTLPGWKYIENEKRREWETKILELTTSLQSAGQSADAQVAALQQAAMHYLELRENVPLSLLNTRSITANSGRGRGESKWLDELRQYDESPATACGVFDQDAAAMLIFNNGIGNVAGVKKLLPDHTSIQGRIDPNSLMDEILRQHVLSLYPRSLYGDKDEKRDKIIFAAINGKLDEAVKDRGKNDTKHWRDQVEAGIKKLRNLDSVSQGLTWLGEASTAHQDLDSTLKYLGLMAEGSSDKVRAALQSLYDEVANTAERALVAAKAAGAGNSRNTLITALKKFTFNFCKNATVVSGRIQEKSSYHIAELVLRQINEDLKSLTKSVEAEEDEISRKEEANASIDGDGEQEEDEFGVLNDETVPRLISLEGQLQDRRSDTSMIECSAAAIIDIIGPDEKKRREILEKFGKGKLNPLDKNARTTNIESILRELYSGIGNSFTVTLDMPDGKTIEYAGLHGRPPSPFAGTMGAHSTAWVVWRNAVENLIEGGTVEQAGNNLVRFAEGIIIDAQQQGKNLTSRAQNALRRENMRWRDSSLSEWQKELLSPPESWSVSSVQAYAQKVLTFINVLPGTTRAGKNTDGHGEAKSWDEAQTHYRSGEMNRMYEGLRGEGLFDAGPATWVRPRHYALLELALGGQSSEAWEKWPSACGAGTQDIEMLEPGDVSEVKGNGKGKEKAMET